MKSEDKFKIELKEVYGKTWVLMAFPRPVTSFMPSFEDVGRVLRAIAQLEDIAYPRADGYLGREMVLNYMRAAIMTDESFESLRQKFVIPQR